MRRALVPGGRIAFTTIEFAPDLSAADRRLLAGVAPRATASRSPYARMLASAGFVDVGFRDVSQEYLETTLAWVRETVPRLDRVGEVDGHEAAADRVASWAAAADAIEAGLLRRGLYWARRR